MLCDFSSSLFGGCSSTSCPQTKWIWFKKTIHQHWQVFSIGRGLLPFPQWILCKLQKVISLCQCTWVEVWEKCSRKLSLAPGIWRACENDSQLHNYEKVRGWQLQLIHVGYKEWGQLKSKLSLFCPSW